jgi:hypothetical protein
MQVTDHRAGVSGSKRPGFLAAGLITLVALIALVAIAAPQGASAKPSTKRKAHTVDATMRLAIIGQSETGYEFVARLTGKPLGTAAAVGETVLTNTPTGLITVGKPVVVYGKKGTLNLETEDVVEFQPDGSISLNGTFDFLGGGGKYKGATGGGTFNGALPPGSTLEVGTVVTFDVDGKVRY